MSTRRIMNKHPLFKVILFQLLNNNYRLTKYSHFFFSGKNTLSKVFLSYYEYNNRLDFFQYLFFKKIKFLKWLSKIYFDFF